MYLPRGRSVEMQKTEVCSADINEPFFSGVAKTARNWSICTRENGTTLTGGFPWERRRSFPLVSRACTEKHTPDLDVGKQCIPRSKLLSLRSTSTHLRTKSRRCTCRVKHKRVTGFDTIRRSVHRQGGAGSGQSDEANSSREHEGVLTRLKASLLLSWFLLVTGKPTQATTTNRDREPVQNEVPLLYEGAD